MVAVVAITVGRFLAGYLVERFGVKMVIIVKQIFSVIAILIYLFWPSSLIMYYICQTIFYINAGICANIMSSACPFLYGVDLSKKLQPIMNICYTAACAWMLVFNVVIYRYLGNDVMCVSIIGVCALIVLGSFKIHKGNE